MASGDLFGFEPPEKRPAAPPARPPDARGTLLEKVRLGTSGYSFKDWVGPFYEPGTKSSEFLPYYAQHFDSVEVNSTYYGIPQPRVMEQMATKTPPGFHFVVKLNQEMTHRNSRDPALYEQFLEVLKPLKAAGKYDGLLAQFPFGFKRDQENLLHAMTVRELLGEEPLHVEFRHDSWLEPGVEPWLRENRMGWTVVDEPRLPGLLPTVPMVTSEDAYVRLHGRNAATWWQGDRSTRYDYSYSGEQLKEWVTRIQELANQARRTYLFFNNCHAGQAAKNAKLMQELLRQTAL